MQSMSNRQSTRMNKGQAPSYFSVFDQHPYDITLANKKKKAIQSLLQFPHQPHPQLPHQFPPQLQHQLLPELDSHELTDTFIDYIARVERQNAKKRTERQKAQRQASPDIRDIQREQAYEQLKKEALEGAGAHLVKHWSECRDNTFHDWRCR
jgi:hypothetical protein